MTRRNSGPPCCEGRPVIEWTEKDLMRNVTQLAQTLGYQVYHPWLSIHSERGFPDMVIWKPGRFILAELKNEKGKLTDSQEEKIASLKACGVVEVYIWRPSQWDELVQVLESKP
jgi:hypothetical protein